MPKPRTTKPAKVVRKPRYDGSDIREHLSKGFSAAETARRTGKAPRSVFEFAERHHLPTNPPIRPGSRLESQILRALVATNLNYRVVGTLFAHTESNIKALSSRVLDEFKSRHPSI